MKLFEMDERMRRGTVAKGGEEKSNKNEGECSLQMVDACPPPGGFTEIAGSGHGVHGAELERAKREVRGMEREAADLEMSGDEQQESANGVQRRPLAGQ